MRLKTSHVVALFALSIGCGGDHEIERYVVEIRVTAPGADARLMDHLLVPHCDNAVLDNETLLVYDGYVPDAVTAIQLVYTGIDLSEDGTNSIHYFLAKNDTVVIVGSLNQTLDLYEINHKGNVSLIEAEKKGGDIEHFYEVIAQPVTEVHEIGRREKIAFVDTFDGWPCLE
jgi:hypothetical protein